MVMRDACAEYDINYFAVCDYRARKSLTATEAFLECLDRTM